MYWAILHKAGFQADLGRLRAIGLAGPNAKDFTPGFSKALRDAAYNHAGVTALPDQPRNINDLLSELETIAKFAIEKPRDSAPQVNWFIW